MSFSTQTIEDKKETFPDSPAPSKSIFISFLAIIRSRLSWFSISSLPIKWVINIRWIESARRDGTHGPWPPRRWQWTGHNPWRKEGDDVKKERRRATIDTKIYFSHGCHAWLIPVVSAVSPLYSACVGCDSDNCLHRPVNCPTLKGATLIADFRSFIYTEKGLRMWVCITLSLFCRFYFTLVNQEMLRHLYFRPSSLTYSFARLSTYSRYRPGLTWYGLHSQLTTTFLCRHSSMRSIPIHFSSEDALEPTHEPTHTDSKWLPRFRVIPLDDQ